MQQTTEKVLTTEMKFFYAVHNVENVLAVCGWSGVRASPLSMRETVKISKASSIAGCRRNRRREIYNDQSESVEASVKAASVERGDARKCNRRRARKNAPYQRLMNELKKYRKLI